ncbi:hypothetical protein F503_08301 [Ophiostoma piceae UAMH 11346]|uniref:Uncharacterized protein n=1 Tax=Ophiostoma piceae (strain UAMH 11346) TaxID=1262450 RepID=S3CY24_OPHP1|nr:hypothetical protein F503_08301 [Ophiostoma piceae UAMH 11346]
MPSALDAPVLQVDANVIHKVDTSNPQNLFSMWTVFARCADNVAQGRRLENLSWRLWTRETFCVENGSGRLPGDRADSFGSVSDSLSVSSSLKPKAIPKRSQPSTEEVPQLSGSVESVADEEAVELSSDPSSTDISRPRIRRQDSCGSNRSRGRERHITSDDLEKMVVSIVQEKQCLTAPFPEISPFVYPTPESQQFTESEETVSAPEPVAESATPIVEPEVELETEAKVESAPEPFPTLAPEQPSTTPAQHDDEELPGASLQKSKSTTEVIRGFSPSHMPVVIPQIFTSPVSDEHTPAAEADDDAIPEPTSAPQAKQVQSKKATFALGGSSSCEDSMSDPSRSLDMRNGSMSQMMKRKPAASPEEEGSLKSAFHLSRHSLAQKKQTSFSNHVMTRTIPAPAVVSDDDSDSDDIDESAIDDDDDDSSDWEDSNEESGRSSMDEKNLFQRVDSTLHLPSRRSLITLMIQRSEHEVKNGLTTSQSTLGLPRTRGQHQPPSLAASPNDSDEPALMMRHRPRGPQSTLRPINEIPRSAAQPIMTSTVGVARSPRTNRRMMLSTELTESLRRHLLWERSQKTSTANAVNVLKRRHTSHDVANLKQFPDPVHMNKRNDNEANTGSWDHYLNRDAFDGYHAKGW